MGEITETSFPIPTMDNKIKELYAFIKERESEHYGTHPELSTEDWVIRRKLTELFGEQE